MTGATTWIRQHPARALTTDAMGDLLLQPSGFTCWCPSTQVCAQIVELGVDITSGSHYPPAPIRWNVDAVRHKIDFFFPSTRTLCVNLELCCASDHVKIFQLLESFVQHGKEVKTFEVYLTQVPSGAGKQERKLDDVISALRETGVQMSMAPRWRGHEEVPNNGWKIPAIIRHTSPPAVCASIQDLIWNDA